MYGGDAAAWHAVVMRRDWLGGLLPRASPMRLLPEHERAAPGHVSHSSVRAKEMEGLTGESDVLLVPRFVDTEGMILLQIQKDAPSNRVD